MTEPCIVRYLKKPEDVTRMRRDFQDLMARVRASHGDLEIMLRDGYFNLYYQGNSLAKVSFNGDGSYDVGVSSQFVVTEKLCDLLPKKPPKDDDAPEKRQPRRSARLSASKLAELLSAENIRAMQKAVRAVNYQPEITFEQLLMAHNPPSEDFFVIDRQVRSRGDNRKIDLLALRRVAGDRYHFVVLEVKLGSNTELADAVARQLKDYMSHITANFGGFADCYQKTYGQRRELPLWPNAKSLPETIEIDPPVEGKIVVFGRNNDVQPKIDRLRENYPEIADEVEVFDFKLKKWGPS
jgi:hypothetical protein